MAGSHTIGSGTTLTASGYYIAPGDGSNFTLVNNGFINRPTAQYGVLANAATPTVVNNRFIIASPTLSAGVWLEDGGTVENEAVSVNGTIEGGDGVYAVGAATVVNHGFIWGEDSRSGEAGVRLQNGGSVTSDFFIKGAYGGVIISGAAGQVVNQNLIQGGVAGVFLNAGGSINNATTSAQITANYAVAISGGAGTVTNAGLILGTRLGVQLHVGGSVTNAQGGTISASSGYGIELNDGGTVVNNGTAALIYSGGNYGIQISGAAGTVTNLGTIRDTALVGVGLLAGGTLNNSGTAAYIGGGHWGAFFGAGGGAVSVTNQGQIFGGVNAGLYFGDGGVLTNTGAKAEVLGVGGGVNVYNAAGTISNEAAILGLGSFGVYLADGGTVTNLGTASFISGKTYGIDADGANPTTIIDQGVIVGQTNDAIKFANVNGNRLEVYPGAIISGAVSAGTGTGNTLALHSGSSVGALSSQLTGFQAVDVANGVNWTLSGNTTLVSGATIALSTSPFAPNVLTIGGSLTIPGPLTLSGFGTLAMAGAGDAQVGTASAVSAGEFLIDSGQTLFTKGRVSVADVVNQGVVSGAGPGGAYAGFYAGVGLLGGGQLTNTGRISGYAGVLGETGAGATVTNHGTITGTGPVGVVLLSGGTVINSGTIRGPSYAVEVIPGYAARVVVDPGAVFSGKVSGGNAIGSGTVSTLELATGTGKGTLTGLGSQYVDFAAVTVDSGATWNLSSGTVVSGQTLTNSGMLNAPVTLAAGAELFNSYGVIAVGASPIAVDVLAGGGAYVVNLRGSFSAEQTGVYLSGTGRVANVGTIRGLGENGVYLQSGGTIFNNPNPTAYIYGGGNGVAAASGTTTVTNAGSIVGKVGYGVYLGGGGTVFNSGSIGGAKGAVKFAPGFANRMQVSPDALFGGNVDGGNAIGAAAVSTLELLPEYGPGNIKLVGTIAGIGSKYVNFADIAVDKYAIWTLPSGSTIAANETLVDNGTLINDGTVLTTVTVAGTAVLTNASGGTIAGGTYGVELSGSGVVTNSAGAVISGSQYAVDGSFGAARTVINLGTLTSPQQGGVLLESGGVVANLGTAAIISGVGTGVDVTDNAGTVTNQGTIFATDGTGVALNAGGTIINAGAIRGVSGLSDAVYFHPNYTNRLVVDPGAIFVGQVDGGNAIGATHVSTLELAPGFAAGTLVSLNSQFVNFAKVVVDSGSAWDLLSDTIAAGQTLANYGNVAGMTLAGGAVLTNAAGGKIVGGTASGVYALGAATVVNSGNIYSDHDGVVLAAGGFLTNLGTGSIVGLDIGVLAKNGAAVVNGATIVYGALSAVYIDGGGSLTNISGGTIAGSKAVRVVHGPGSVTNQAGGSISGSSGGILFFNGAQAGTVVNGGSIAGGSGAAVQFASGYANRLIVDPGAVFSGTVRSGNPFGATAVSTLELASGASAGTLSGLGSQFLNFASIAVDAGATWSLSPNTIVSGQTLNNAGTLGAGVTLAGGATVTNAMTGTIGSGSVPIGVDALGAVTLVNYGQIAGSAGHAVLLNAGGSVSNAAGGVIGGSYGILVSGSAGTVVNQGLITAGIGGIFMTAGGSITNAGTGVIHGNYAIAISGGAAVVTNAAQIIGARQGIGLSNGGTVINQDGGTIVGTYGVQISNAAGTVRNAGAIDSGAGNKAVNLLAGFANLVAIYAGATFSGTVNGGNTIGATAVSTLELGSSASDGTLSGVGTQYLNFADIVVAPGASWTLQSGATIGANYTLIDNGTLINDGALLTAVTLGAGATLINANTASIAVATGVAVFDLTGPGTVVNYGQLTEQVGSGILLQLGGAVTNQANGTITGGFGVLIDGAAGTVTNAGLIQTVGYGIGVALYAGGTVVNLGGAISGIGGPDVPASDAGINIKGGAGTVINDATITGNGGAAVLLASGYANRVVVAPGAVFSGTVNGGNTIGATAVSTLELASAASTGTLNSIGSQFVGFGQVTVDSGANWALYGTLNSGQTLFDAGTLFTGNHFQSSLKLAGGAVSIAQTGVISGKYDVVFALNTETVTNAGSIVGGRFGVVLSAGGVLTNQGSGSIHGYDDSVFVQSGATVINSGTIYGGQFGAVSLYKGGSLTNFSGGTISGPAGGVYSVGGAATVVNGGTIAGGTYAVQLAAGYANRLVIDPGAVFSGTVAGAYVASSGTVLGTAVSTLELASGNAIGTLSGFGSHYIGFGAVSIDQGAIWAFNTADTLAAGTYLTDNGTLLLSGNTLTSAGPVTIGDSTNGSAAMSVSGAGAVFNSATNLSVGRVGSGALDVTAGGSVTAGVLDVGVLAYFDTTTGALTPLGDGVVTVDGAGSALTTRGEMLIGGGSVGSMTIKNGARAIAEVDVGASPGAVIAEAASGGGSSVNVNGVGSTWIVDFGLVVGAGGTGELNVTAGGSVLATSVDAATASTGNGIIVVADRGSELQVTGSLTLGDQSAGELSILGGATVSAGSLTVGNLNAASSGNVDVEGAGSTLQIGSTGVLNVGVSGGGSGVLTIGQGSTLMFSGGIVEAGRASVNNNGGVIDPDFIEFTTASATPAWARTTTASTSATSARCRSPRAPARGTRRCC